MQFEAFPRYIEELSREISGRGNFMIPDYQRPYKWGIDECETLWNDIKDAFKEKQSESHFEYFLGSIVTYKNSETKNLDIIDTGPWSEFMNINDMLNTNWSIYMATIA